jgi:hypothetical protein
MLKPEPLRVLALTGASVAISALADTHNGQPVSPSSRIDPCQRRKGLRARDASESPDRYAFDLDPITRKKLDIMTRYPLVQLLSILIEESIYCPGKREPYPK